MATEQPAPTFYQELVELINRHSMENYSGTPDWILGEYLRKCMEAWDLGMRLRSEWRGDSMELPALNGLRAAAVKDQQEIPLVMYTEGRRNEIGTAQVEVTPGEMRVTGQITGVIPIFGDQLKHLSIRKPDHAD